MGFHAAAAVLFERTRNYRLMSMYGVTMSPLGTLASHIFADFMDAQSGRRHVDWAGHLGGAAAGYFFVNLVLRGGQPAGFFESSTSYTPRPRTTMLPSGGGWVIN